MPSLQPGTPSAKEAYGISRIREDLKFTIPPEAVERYGIMGNDAVVLVTGRRGEGGFGLIKKDTAMKSVFSRYVEQIQGIDQVNWFNRKAYTMIRVVDGRVQLTRDMLQAYCLEPGSRLLVVKSTTITMSFTPVEIWARKLAKHGFNEAIKNIENLEEF